VRQVFFLSHAIISLSMHDAYESGILSHVGERGSSETPPRPASNLAQDCGRLAAQSDARADDCCPTASLLLYYTKEDTKEVRVCINALSLLCCLPLSSEQQLARMCGLIVAACLPLSSLLAACSSLSSAGHPRLLLAAPNLHLSFAMATHLQLPRALLELDILVPQVRYFSTSKLYRKP
jgi:hypothetical protein